MNYFLSGLCALANFSRRCTICSSSSSSSSPSLRLWDTVRRGEREREKKIASSLTFLVVVLLQPAFSQILSSLSVFLDPHTNDIICDVYQTRKSFSGSFSLFLLDFHCYVSVLYRNQVGHEKCIYKVAEVRSFLSDNNRPDYL